MQHLRKILREYSTGLGIESGTVLNAVRRKWTDTVGATVAAHTFPDTIKGKEITIIVDTPQWMHHLSFFKEEISEKLKSLNISDVRFRLGKLPEKDGPGPEEECAELTDEDLRFIENTLKNVDDEELKATFKKLIVHGLTKGKR